MILHWIGHLLGLDNVSGPFYAFWSGVGLTVGWPFVQWRRHNCHVRFCPWPGHIDPETHHPACKKHHSRRHLLGSAGNAES